MRLNLGYVFQAAVYILFCIDAPTAQGSQTICPIGFSLFYSDESPLCYRPKGRETFAEKYDDCVGNLFNTKLYFEFKSPDYNDWVWTEYKTIYSGGSFVDWSHTKSIGKVLNADRIHIDSSLYIEKELCLVVDPDNNFKAVRCNERHQSFCVVKPYVKEKSMTNKGCEGLNDSLRFLSPESTCLSALTGVGGANVRATWNQAQNLCINKGGSLLNRGWRYSNYPKFRVPEINHTYPLGIIMSNDYSLLRYDAMIDHTEIPNDEWNFKNIVNNTDTLLGSLHNDVWHLVNSSFIFYNVICERAVPLKAVKMNLVLDRNNTLTLTVNDTLEEEDVFCFTDSKKLYYNNGWKSGSKVKVKQYLDTNKFVLSPEDDGYYWCTHINTKQYRTTESNKVLYIRNKESLLNTYAVHIRNNFTLYKAKTIESFWDLRLKKYIYWKNTCESCDEKNLSSSEECKDCVKKWSTNLKFKKLFPDGYSALLHIDLEPDMSPVTSGSLKEMKFFSMKPVYFCKAIDTISQLSLGESFNTRDCQTHTCVGDFNEGVQIVTTATPDCLPFNKLMAQVTIMMPTVLPKTTSNSVPILKDNTSESSEEIVSDYPETGYPTTEAPNITDPTETQELETTETEYSIRPPTKPIPSSTVTYPDEVITVTTPTDVVTVDPTTTTETPDTTPVVPFTTSSTPAPEQQLEQVLQDLDRLVNGSTPVTVDDISDVFNQVDNILEVHDSLDIPGQLLHLLDQLGSAVELNGLSNAAAVRDNIALLMADASPTNPVRGLKIATRDYDVFNNDAFQIISESPNSTILDSERNEVVVHLPQSVSEATHRISFVVFRNDRAFQSNEVYSVNSRVLSIKVGDVTKFDDGEVIDIHLSPMTSSPERNQTRTCAYWEFLEDGTGYWSQEGCTLIRATQPGMMDTCRCTHLTHFAEILFPRSVFSKENEDALELLSIIGCCLSLSGLVLVGITACTFRSWRRDFNNKIWLQLCIAIFILALNFLIIIFKRFETYDLSCMIMGIALHYSMLASFCWMLVAAVISYRRLVLVFTRDASHKLLKASAFCWGAPCAIIGVLISIDPQAYEDRFEDKSPSGAFCYPSGLGRWLAVFTPIVTILLVNWTLFALIVRSVFSSRGIQRHGDTNEALRCATVSCLLVFLFGLPWVLGLFAFNVVAAYLFTITASYQGFVLFLFFVLGNKKTRDLWLNKLKIKQTRKVPVTSSTYSNRSTGWRAQGMTEVKIAKPKSLTQDDSRFS